MIQQHLVKGYIREIFEFTLEKLFVEIQLLIKCISSLNMIFNKISSQEKRKLFIFRFYFS